jgi:DNA polymerase-3 subunit delta
LLRDEAIKKIELLASQRGYTSIKRWQVDAHFDWLTFFANLNQRDMFSEKRLLELHLNANKLSTETSNALITFLAQESEQQILLFSCDKLDKATLKNKYLSAIEKYGELIQLWPPDASALPKWLADKSLDYGIKLSNASLVYLAAHSEGNLTAATQILEKLFLHDGPAIISDEQVYASLYDSSRYSVFNLVETWLSDDKARSYKILRRLKTEAIEPILIWWALIAECRLLAQIQFRLAKNESLSTLLTTFHIWKKREPLIKMHLRKQYNYQAGLQQLIFIERVIKGIEKANVWDELERFLVKTF